MNYQAGDVFFHRDAHDFAAWWIRFAESHKYSRRHFGNGPTSPAYWNHCGIITDSVGSILEATPSGVQRNTIHEYDYSGAANLAVYRPTYPEIDGAQRTEKFAMEGVGEKYDNLNLLSDAMYLLFRSTIRFGVAGRDTCSGFIAHALTLGGGVDMGNYEDADTPADVFAMLVFGNRAVLVLP